MNSRKRSSPDRIDQWLKTRGDIADVHRDQLKVQLQAHDERQYRSYPLDIQVAEDGVWLKRFQVIPYVMRPDLMTSLFLARYLYLHRSELDDRTIIDMGCGSGILGIVAAQLCGARQVFFTDVDEVCIRNTMMNVARLPKPIRERCVVLPPGDLFAPFGRRRPKADCLVFNHPFFPYEPDPEFRITLSMLAPPRKVIQPFLKQATAFLAENGQIWMPFFHLAKPGAGSGNDPAEAIGRKYRLKREIYLDETGGLQQGTLSINRLVPRKPGAKAKQVEVVLVSQKTTDIRTLREEDWADLTEASGDEPSSDFQDAVFRPIIREALASTGRIDNKHAMLCVYVTRHQHRMPSEFLDAAGRRHAGLNRAYEEFREHGLEQVDLTRCLIRHRAAYAKTPFYLEFAPRSEAKRPVGRTTEALGMEYEWRLSLVYGGKHRAARMPGVPTAPSAATGLASLLSILQKDERFSFQMYLEAMARFPQAGRWLYLLPILVGPRLRPILVGSVLVAASEELGEGDLSRMLEVVRRNLTPVRIAEFLEEVRGHSLHSALAAIMSRNMSHNLGSHVLAVLGVEGKSAADDRVLYRYLQQRMDYIAQISTEVPGWATSAWFINDIIRRFLKQRHLLSFIGAAEGLRAYSWGQAACTEGCIAFHVGFLRPGKGNECLVPTMMRRGQVEWIVKPGSGSNGAMRDCEVAIPGGVVGFHAIYTIIENVIRNAAKHGVRNRKDPAGPAATVQNLDIKIVIDPEPVCQRVRIVIWDGASEIARGIVENLNKSLTACLTDDCGRLRRENWGLAEMRISAGFLNRACHEVIGSGETVLLTKENPDGFISAVAVRDEDGVDRLGYVFTLEVPSRVLLAGDYVGALVLKSGVDQAKLREFGIEVRSGSVGSRSHSGHSGRLDFDFVVCDQKWLTDHAGTLDAAHPGGESRTDAAIFPHLPARVLIVTEEGTVSLCRPGDYGFWASRITAGELRVALEPPDRLSLRLYGYWIDHLAAASPWRKDSMQLWFDAGGVGDKAPEMRMWHAWEHVRKEVLPDLLHRLLTTHTEEMFLPAKLRDYVYAWVRDKICAAAPRDWTNFESGLSNMLPAAVASAFSSMPGEFTAELEIQLRELANRIEREIWPMSSTALRTVQQLVFKYDEEIETLPPVLRGGGSAAGAQDRRLHSLSGESGVMEDEPFNVSTNSGIDPRGAAKQVTLGSLCELLKKDGVPSRLHIKSAACIEDANVIYRRHTAERSGDDVIHSEALSGAQSSFATLQHCLRSATLGLDLVLELIENALVRILILDERVADYAEKRWDVRGRYHHSGIVVPTAVVWDGRRPLSLVPTPSSTGLRPPAASGAFFYLPEGLEPSNAQGGWVGLSDSPVKQCHALVVHQGVLDKLFPEVGATALKDDARAPSLASESAFLAAMHKAFPMVFVTSGRGRPERSVREKFIPFSTIESYVMKEYPEKLLLVQTLMRVTSGGQT